MNQPILIFLILLAIVHLTLASITTKTLGKSPEEISNPMLNPQSCGRGEVSKSALCDPDDLLTTEEKDVIEGFMNKITLAQIGVVIIQQMNKKFIGSKSIERSSELFAKSIHDNWGVGDKALNNGILLFLSISDRSIYISTGKGVKKMITNQVIDSLIDNMKPSLRMKKYSEAIEKCVVELGLIFEGKSETIAKYAARKRHENQSNHSSNDNDGYIFWGIFAIILISVGALAYYQSLKLKKLEKGKIAIEKFMKEIGDCKDGNNFLTKSCPICLDDFPAETLPQDDNIENLIEPKTMSQTITHRKAKQPQSNNPSPVIVDENDATGVSSGVNLGNIASETSEVESVSPHRPMALPCGHTFCFSCLNQYLKSENGTKCPICRKSVVPDDKNNQPPPTQDQRPFQLRRYNPLDNPSCHQSSINTPTHTPSTTAWTHRQPEFIYRTNRLRTLYPDVVTLELLRTMNQSLETGSVDMLRSSIDARRIEVQRTITDIQTRNEARSSGSRGSSHSFGGGSSYGGGGGGGSW